MSKISGQLLISGQFQDKCEISGISGQLGAMRYDAVRSRITENVMNEQKYAQKTQS